MQNNILLAEEELQYNLKTHLRLIKQQDYYKRDRTVKSLPLDSVFPF